MRLALSGTELEEQEGLEALIDAARHANIDAVELWHPRNTPNGLQHALEKLAAAGIEAICLSSGIELFRDAGSEHEQRRLLDLIAMAADAAVPRVNTYFGFSSKRDDARAIDGYLRAVQPCIALAEKRGVTIVLENEFNAFGWDPACSDVTRRPDALRQLVSRAGSDRFRITFDPANFVCAGVTDIVGAYDLIAPFVGYVHVKDVVPLPAAGDSGDDSEAMGWRSYTDFERRYRTCPLGEGTVPWRPLIEALTSDGYDGAFALEPHSQTHLRQQAWTGAAEQFRALLMERSRRELVPSR
jgi:sugar phosphate isomerase/epimerase